MELKEITAALRQFAKDETCQCGKPPLVGVVGGRIKIICDRCGNHLETDKQNIEEIKTLWIQENQ